MSRGIFSLNESYNEQVSGDWSTASDVWLIGSPVIVRESPFGYLGGGEPGHIRRIDFANDTNLAPSRTRLTNGDGKYVVAMSSQDYGYWSGYLGPTTPSNGVTNIDRLDYGNDTAAMVVRANMPSNVYAGTGTHSLHYGYYCGGGGVTTVPVSYTHLRAHET